jgi:IS30 family transposase
MRTDILENKELILQWITEEVPKREIAKRLKCKQETLNSYLKKMQIDYTGQQNKKGQQKGPNKYRSASYYLVKHGPTIHSHKLKLKLIKEGIKQDVCESCGLSHWLGKKLPLELHHKDGDHFNNELSNLEILCPNCHSVSGDNAGAAIGNYT